MVIAGPVAAVLSFTSLGEIGASMSESLWQLVFVAGPVVVIVPTAICFQILTRNIIVSALVLGDVSTFRSELNPMRYLWIVLSNFVVTVLTAFVMHPWAQIRQYRYQAERITVRPTSEIGTFLDTEARSGQAFGEEFGEIQDVGVAI